jgi:histidyl-tRNA synthetase
MAIIQPVKGTRDFYPEELALRRWLYEKIRTVSEQYGYQEYDGPFLERLELYAAKSGEELVQEQSFVFPDRSGEMIALRPELTPSLARMLATRSRALPKPIRWWSFGPFWRYERPQKGRSREFFQWNIDLLGVDSPQADAEIASIAAAFFQACGVTPNQVRIKINNRRLAETRLAEIGISEGDRQQVFRLIDRKSKLSPAEWEASATEIGLSATQLDDIKANLMDREAWRAFDELVQFFDAVDIMGTSAYMEYDPEVIRGLDYYTGTVFEAHDQAGEERAILGGGRYDNLVADVGGDALPGVGFAMGDVVIGLVLTTLNIRPSLRVSPADVFIPIFDEESRKASLQLAAELRSHGVRVEWFPEVARLPRQLKYADRYKIPLAIIQGPDEIATGKLSIKDLTTGKQTEIPRQDVVRYILDLLSENPAIDR